MGYGSIQRAERAFGKKPGWLRERRRSNRIELSILLELLAALDLDAQDFFDEALAERSEARWRPPRGRPPAAVRRALERARQADPSGTAPVGADELDRLDALRYDEPRSVLARGRRAVDRVAVVDLPRLLGILASAHRILGEGRQAAQTVYAALEIHDARGSDARTRGDLLLRLAYVIADEGDHREAVRHAEEALVAYVRAGDRARAGRALFPLGSFQLGLGLLEAAQESFEAALVWLPAEERQSRCAVHQGLAEVSRLRGDVKAALGWLEQARENIDAFTRLDRGKVVWLEGSLLAQSGDLEEAERRLAEAQELLRSSPVDAALAGIRRLQLLLEAGRPREAGRIARDMARYLAPFEKVPIAAAALREITVRGLEGRLTLEAVTKAQRALQSERDRSGAHPLPGFDVSDPPPSRAA